MTEKKSKTKRWKITQDEFKAKLKQFGLTQGEFAKQFGVSGTSVSLWSINGYPYTAKHFFDKLEKGRKINNLETRISNFINDT